MVVLLQIWGYVFLESEQIQSQWKKEKREIRWFVWMAYIWLFSFITYLQLLSKHCKRFLFYIYRELYIFFVFFSIPKETHLGFYILYCIDISRGEGCCDIYLVIFFEGMGALGIFFFVGIGGVIASFCYFLVSPPSPVAWELNVYLLLYCSYWENWFGCFFFIICVMYV